MVEWEEVPVKSLFNREDEMVEDGREPSPLEIIMNRYIESDATLRILHTNFNLTFRILKVISSTNGIETMVPIGRYRLAVSFGKLFNMEDVKGNVKKNINSLLYPKGGEKPRKPGKNTKTQEFKK